MTVYTLYFLTILAVSMGLVVGFMALRAWYNVRTSPREAMAYCQKHGPLMRSQIVTFVDTEYCGRCWYSRYKAAARVR